MKYSPIVAMLTSVIASPNAFAENLIAPVGILVGDGVSTATIHLLLDDPSLKVKVKPSKGKLVDLVPVAGGYAIEYLPPDVTEPTAITITVKLKGQTKQTIEQELSVFPAAGGGFSVSFDPPSVRPGDSTQVIIRPDRSSQIEETSRVILANPSIGELTPLIAAGDGTWVGRYTAPADITVPTQALLAVTDMASPYDTVGFETLPIAVTDTITLDAPAGSKNILKLAGREYGPTSADIEGHVSFEVEVNPGVPYGDLESVTPEGGASTRKALIPMEVPPALVIAPAPTSVPAGSDAHFTAFCAIADGSPCDGSEIIWSADTDAKITATNDRIGGSTATVSSAAMTLSATYKDATTDITLQDLPSMVRVSLAADPPTLPDNSDTFSLSARVKDMDGRGVLERPPSVEVEGARLTKRQKDNGDGTYISSYKLKSADTPAAAVMAPPLSPTGLPASNLVIWPSVQFVAADGRSRVSIVVVGEDALGSPVPNIDLSFAIPNGDGAIVPSATTGKSGVTHVMYTAGNSEGLTTIVVEGAGIVGTTNLWQATPGNPVPAVVTTGSKQNLDAIKEWQSRSGVLSVGHQVSTVTIGTGSTPVAVVPMQAAVPGKVTVDAKGGGRSGVSSISMVGSQETPWMRARLRLLNAPFNYSSTSAGSNTYAEAADFAITPWFGAGGIDLESEAWFADKFGVEVEVRLRSFSLAIAGEEQSALDLDLGAGGRYKAWSQGIMSASAGLGWFKSSEVAFAYTDAIKSSGTFEEFPYSGGRLSGDFKVETGPWMAKIELSEVFTPGPSITNADITIDLPLPSSIIGLSIGAGITYRSNTLEGTDGTAISATRLGKELMLGVGYSL